MQGNTADGISKRAEEAGRLAFLFLEEIMLPALRTEFSKRLLAQLAKLLATSFATLLGHSFWYYFLAIPWNGILYWSFILVHRILSPCVLVMVRETNKGNRENNRKSGIEECSWSSPITFSTHCEADQMWWWQTSLLLLELISLKRWTFLCWLTFRALCRCCAFLWGWWILPLALISLGCTLPASA